MEDRRTRRMRGGMLRTLRAQSSLETSVRSDAELVKAAAGGSDGAFAELVERHRGSVCALAFALTGNLAHSEEIAHESLVIAWRRLAAFDQAYPFGKWLSGIARNLVRQRG